MHLSDRITTYSACGHANREVVDTWREVIGRNDLPCLVCRRMRCLPLEEAWRVQHTVLAPFYAQRRVGEPDEDTDRRYHCWLFSPTLGRCTA